eukprot:gene265-348_t
MSQVTRKNETESSLVTAIVSGMQDKKVQDLIVINLKKINTAVASYFIVGTGQSRTQVDAIADGAMESASKNAGKRPWKKEGLIHKEWVILDYMDVVVHIFQPEARELYRLDLLWKDAEITPYEENLLVPKNN